MAFLSEIVQKTGTENSETMQIKRNGYGEGQKEAALSMQVEGEKKQDIEIRVSPKIYSEKRLEKEFQKARKELAKVISGENKDLSHIKTDLDLVTALDDFPFSVSWELSRYDVMDSLGRLDQEKIREEDPENQGIGMNITGVLHYEDKVYPCEMDLVIFAGQEKTLSTKERVLELVRSQDSATRQKAYLTLPPSLDGRKIAWTEEKDSKGIPILMLGMAISILLVGREIQKENNQKKMRKEQMMLDYPEIITEFTMLTGAGMTAKNVWKRIAEDYGITRGKTGRKREAYEEIWKTWQEMKSGIPEMECYERFARRCDLIPYMKMGALLSQNLKKGAKGISEMLRMEAVQALEDRKSRARQLGEGSRVYSKDGLSCTITSTAGGMGGKTGLYDVGVPIKENTKKGYKMAYEGDSIDLGYAGMNTRRGRVGHQVAHTLTTGSTQGTVHFVDLDSRLRVTEVARCITTRQNSLSDKHLGERSGALEEEGPRAVLTPERKNIRQQGRRMKAPEEEMFTLTAQDRHGVCYEGRIRRLTPRECLRLQGYYEEQIDKILELNSDAQAYKQAGNGVTVNVIEAIGRRLFQVHSGIHILQ